MCAGRTATLDHDDPIVRQLERYGPDTASPWPFRYGESLGAPRYTSLPTAAEQRRAEWDLADHTAKVGRARAAKTDDERRAVDADLVGVDLEPAGKGPPELLPVDPFVRENRDRIAKGPTVAWKIGRAHV